MRKDWYDRRYTIYRLYQIHTRRYTNGRERNIYKDAMTLWILFLVWFSVVYGYVYSVSMK